MSNLLRYSLSAPSLSFCFESLLLSFALAFLASLTSETASSIARSSCIWRCCCSLSL